MKRKKGYIGFSGGASILINEHNKNNSYEGVHFNILDIGHISPRKIGFGGTIFFTKNYLEDSDSRSSRGGILIGPLGSFSASPRIDIELLPFLGVALANNQTNYIPNSSTNNIVLAFSLRLRLNYNISEQFSLAFTSEYLTTSSSNYKNQTKNITGYATGINTFNFNLGFFITIR